MHIEEDEIRPGDIGEGSLTTEVANGILAVLDDSNMRPQLSLLEGLDHEIGVIRTVLDKEDFDRGTWAG
jgi:hypothetical protein